MGAEGFSAAERLLQKVIEGEGAALSRHQVELGHAVRGRAQRRERPVARLEHEEASLVLVDDLEMRRDIGLERKQPQQTLGEGMQRLNLEPARRLDRAGEQLPRESELRRAWRRRTAFDDRLREGLVRKARPSGELGEDTLGHVGRRGLCVGQAQDLRRRRSLEQEPHHPLGQDMGLAAAGVGRHPGRGLRV